ncbi:uncharacterized protein LOC134840434 isoform X2 [Symsagittifera roscoffensis]|uniref:uncharacterized protein LOC134840434 isoform X2 n=1 Tax=Symsagittifera roscoffensis TaxID=84072 RepID=UPI00307B16E4
MCICVLLVFDGNPMGSAQNFKLNNHHPAHKKGGGSEYGFLPRVIPDKHSRQLQLKSNWDVVEKLADGTTNTLSPPQKSELTTSYNILPKQPLDGVTEEGRRSFDAQSMRLLSMKHDMNKSSSNYVFNANNMVSSFIRHQQTGQLQPLRRGTRATQYPVSFPPVSSQRQEWAHRFGVDMSGASEKLQVVPRPKKVNYQQIMREQRENRARLRRQAQIKLKWKGAYERIVQDRRTRRERVYTMFDKCCQDLLKKHYSRKDRRLSEQYGVLMAEMNKVLHSDWQAQREKVDMGSVLKSIDRKHKAQQHQEMIRTVKEMEAKDAEKEAASKAEYDEMLASKTKQKNIDIMIDKYLQTRRNSFTAGNIAASIQELSERNLKSLSLNKKINTDDL